MTVLGLSHVNLRGNRATLEILKNFYIDVVGLTLGNRPPFASFGYWLCANGIDVVHLSVSDQVEERIAGKTYTVDHFALNCADVNLVIANLERHGIGFRRTKVPLTGQTQLFFNDPVGNGVELNFAGDE